MLNARAAVRNLKEYHPPLGNRDGLRLDFNENTVGCSPSVLKRLRQIDGETLARYPERDVGEQVVAEHLGISPKELLLTNGTDEAIHLVCEAYLQPNDEALIVVPTFAMFEIYAAATGAKVISIPAGPDFKFPIAAVLAHVNRRGDSNARATRLIAIANPNNPTGTLVSENEVASIAKAAPDAAVLIDEAYFEFCGQTMLPRWRELPNLFVTRTFSKAYGLAGLRIGMLMGNKDQMALLRRASSPYNLNSIALECLPHALKDEPYVRDYVGQVLEGRRVLKSELADWGVRFWPSRANFVLFYLADRCKPFIREMRTRGILLRDRSNDYGCQDCVRITLGTHDHNQRMLVALRETFVELDLKQQVAR